MIGVNFGRVGFLTSIAADDLEAGARRASSRGEYLVVELPTLEVRAGGEARRRSTTSSSTSSTRADDRARLGDRRRGPRRPAVRRGHLRDAVRLDGLQPLERRAGARLGARGDGGDVRRAALAARAAARRAARARRRSRTGPATFRRQVLVDGHAGRRSSPAAGGCRVRLGDERTPARARCPRRRSSGTATAETVLLRRLRIENLVLIREAELEPAGLNAITGETGAGKTILAQAIGLLLGAKGDAAFVGPGAAEAYVEAEFDVPAGLARRGRARGARRAAAGGRGRARPGAARVRGRPHARLRVGPERGAGGSGGGGRAADRDVGPVRAAPARAALVPARRPRRVRRRGAAAAAGARRGARGGSCGGSPAARRADAAARRPRRRGSRSCGRSSRTRTGSSRRTRGRAARRAGAAPARDRARGGGRGRGGRARAGRGRGRGRPHRAGGAVGRPGRAPRSRARACRRPSCATPSSGCAKRRPSCAAFSTRSRPSRSGSSRSSPSWSGSPTRKRRFRCETYAELLAARGRGAGRARCARGRRRPGRRGRGGARRGRGARRATGRPAAKSRARPRGPFETAVAAELHGVGMGEGEFRVELRSATAARPAPTRSSFLIRPNRGCRSRPVAETASGGELSRIALAIAAVAGGETMVFDEIDAGIGGETAHAVGETLRAARRARAGHHDHAPAADREPSPTATSASRRSPAIRRTRGSSRWTRTARGSELERMLGGAEFLHTRAMTTLSTFIEFTGQARLDRRTKNLARRLEPGRHRDHRPHRPRPRVGRGADRVGRARGRQRGRRPRPGGSRTRGRCCSCAAACG